MVLYVVENLIYYTESFLSVDKITFQLAVFTSCNMTSPSLFWRYFLKQNLSNSAILRSSNVLTTCFFLAKLKNIINMRKDSTQKENLLKNNLNFQNCLNYSISDIDSDDNQYQF